MRNIVKSFLRIFSIYIIIESIIDLPQLIASFSHTKGLIKLRIIYGIYCGLFIAIIFVIGILLWLYADKIAKCIVGKMNENIRLNPQQLLRIAISIIGLVFIVNSIPNILAGTALTIYNPAFSNDIKNAIDDVSKAIFNDLTRIGPLVIKAILGILLMVFSKFLANIILYEKNNKINNTNLDIHITDNIDLIEIQAEDDFHIKEDKIK